MRIWRRIQRKLVRPDGARGVVLVYHRIATLARDPQRLALWQVLTDGKPEAELFIATVLFDRAKERSDAQQGLLIGVTFGHVLLDFGRTLGHHQAAQDDQEHAHFGDTRARRENSSPRRR